MTESPKRARPPTETHREKPREPENFDEEPRPERFSFRKAKPVPGDLKREVRLRDLARKLLPERGEGDRDLSLSMDTAREALGAIIETGDRAKTEIVRLVAREVRSYLEALELKEYIGDLLENYSIEVNATFRLKPNEDRPPRKREEPKDTERDASEPEKSPENERDCPMNEQDTVL